MPTKTAAVLLLAFCFAGAYGQKMTNPFSLEYLVDSSDVVVRATIVEIREGEVDVEVKEALKGEVPARITIAIHPAPTESENLVESRKAQNEALWFLVRDGVVYRLDNIEDRVHGLVISQLGRRIFPMSLAGYHIGNDSSLMADIRKEASLVPGRHENAISIVPPLPFGIPTITLPRDERIEKLARQWVQPMTGEAGRRLSGVRVLEHFRSPQNFAILKAMVHDPGGTDSIFGKSDFREEAARILTQWDIPLPSPPAAESFDPSTVSPKPIRVTIDGKEMKFEKGVSLPRLIGGHAYVRAASISVPLHVSMTTYLLANNVGVCIDAERGTLDMQANSHTIWVDDQVEQAPLAARMIRGEVFFPVRWVVERLGGTVKWNTRLRRVEIKTGYSAFRSG